MAFAALAVGAYLASLAWTIPAEFALPAYPGVVSTSGTLWRGEAVLANGDRLAWRWAPLRSLVGFGFATDWTATGPETDLAGRALVRPGGLLIDQASGTATGSLLAAALPDLPFLCAMRMRVDLARLKTGGATQPLLGEIQTEPGSCTPKAGGTASFVPALAFSATRAGDGSELLLVPAGQRRRTLADGAIDAKGRVNLRVTPEGAALLPFASTPGGLRLEMRL